MRQGSARSATGWGVVGAVVSGIAASVCCVVPLVLLALGVGGAWASSLRFLEPLRPVFVLLTLGFLGFAFYRVYRTPAASCSADGTCTSPSSNRRARAALWVATPLVLGLLAVPYLTHYLAPSGSGTPQSPAPATAGTREVVLRVDGMTCAACSVTVDKSLTAVPGVGAAKVTNDPPQAVVRYDPGRVSVEKLMQATAQAGYPSGVEPNQSDAKE